MLMMRWSWAWTHLTALALSSVSTRVDAAFLRSSAISTGVSMDGWDGVDAQPPDIGMQLFRKVDAFVLDTARQDLPGEPSLRAHMEAENIVAERATPALKGGKLHFLFLIGKHIELPGIWSKFFAEAPPGSHTVWAHCSDDCDVAQLHKTLPAVQVVPQVPSSYCSDLVTPMWQLVRHALKTPPATGPDKFIFVSDATIPFKPFEVVFQSLMHNSHSEFSIHGPAAWARTNVNGSVLAIVRSSQWSVLNRFHAQKFVDVWRPMSEQDSDAGTQANSDVGWTLNVHRGPFRNQPIMLSRRAFDPPLCTDSEAVFASIFGVFIVDSWPPKPMNFPGLGVVDFAARAPQGRHRTFWAFEDSNDSLYMQLLADAGSSLVPGSGSHPATIKNISETALDLVRESPYLFGRKFVQGSVSLDSYCSRVLARRSVPPDPTVARAAQKP